MFSCDCDTACTVWLNDQTISNSRQSDAIGNQSRLRRPRYTAEFTNIIPYNNTGCFASDDASTYNLYDWHWTRLGTFTVNKNVLLMKNNLYLSSHNSQ